MEREQARPSAEVVVDDRFEGFQIGSPVELVGVPEGLCGRWIIAAADPATIGIGFQDRGGVRLTLHRPPVDDDAAGLEAVEKLLAEKYLAEGRRATFCAIPVTRLSHDGLIGVIGGLMRERERLQDLHRAGNGLMMELARRGH